MMLTRDPLIAGEHSRYDSVRSDKRFAMLKIAMKWLVLGVFALQATGILLFAHLAECSEPSDAVCCQCGHIHNVESSGLARANLEDVADHPAAPGKHSLPRHDSQQCLTCQLLLTLSAITPILSALPAINQITLEQPVLSDRPIADTFLATLDARGPPAGTL